MAGIPITSYVVTSFPGGWDLCNERFDDVRYHRAHQRHGIYVHGGRTQPEG